MSSAAPCTSRGSLHPHDGDGRTRAGGLSTPMTAPTEPTEPRRRHRRRAREHEAAKRHLERDVERDIERGPSTPALQLLSRRTGDCSSSRGGVRSGCWRLQSGLQGTTGKRQTQHRSAHVRPEHGGNPMIPAPAEPSRRKDCTPHHNIITRVFNKEKPGNHKVCRDPGLCGEPGGLKAGALGTPSVEPPTVPGRGRFSGDGAGRASSPAAHLRNPSHALSPPVRLNGPMD